IDRESGAYNNIVEFTVPGTDLAARVITLGRFKEDPDNPQRAQVAFYEVYAAGSNEDELRASLGTGGSDQASATVISELASDGFNVFNIAFWPQFEGWLRVIFNTIWTPYPNAQTIPLTIFFVVVIFALFGLAQAYWRYPDHRFFLAFLGLHGALFFILPMARLILINSKTVAGQGHHILFPTIGAVALFMSWGLGAWFSTAKGWWAGLFLGSGLMVWTTIHIVQIFPVAMSVPVKTIPPVLPDSASEFSIQFDNVSLQGYELIDVNQEGACCNTSASTLRLHLYWLAEDLSTEDYRIQVDLVDSMGKSQTAWMGYTANGRYPGRAWEPGDIIQDEIHLPLTGLVPGDYTVQLQVWGHQALLPATNGETLFNLAQLQMQLPPLTTGLPPFSLWQMGQVKTNTPDFENRSTIQITTRPGVQLSGLMSEAGAVYPPTYVAGYTYNFIVDPLWAKGNYRLQLTEPQAGYDTDPILDIVGQERQAVIPASQVDVNANFADQIMLLGYNLPQRRFESGQMLPITLNWQALQTMPTDFVMFTRIRDTTGQVWGGYDRWPREFYSPLLWAKGEVVEDGFTLGLDPNAPDGLYYLDVGFYLLVGESPVSLPLIQNGQMGDLTSVTIGPIKVGSQPYQAVTNASAPATHNLMDQPFGEPLGLTLLGYDSVKVPGDDQNLTTKMRKLILYWRSEDLLDVDYTTFVHIRDSTGKIIAQKDQPPLGGSYPTSLWEVGEIIADEILISLPNELPAGNYEIIVGMYDLTTGQRLSIPNNRANEIVLKAVKVHAP
ncbi:MAG: hypothetical protein AAF485_08655, partial [Chloroflexota bacterium]